MTFSNQDQEKQEMQKRIALQEKTITNLYAKYMKLKNQTTGSFTPSFNIDQEVWVILKNNIDNYPKIIKDKVKEIRVVKNREIKYVLYTYITDLIYPTEQKAKTALKELLKGNKLYG